MIAEDYVSYEVAKLLKEKGFDEYCDSIYILENGDYRHSKINVPCRNSNNYKPTIIVRPTHQMVMKWLREVHNMYINICASGGSLGWWYHIWAIPTHENKLSHRLLRRGEDYPYLSYEEAIEAALKYCLTKLI